MYYEWHSPSLGCVLIAKNKHRELDQARNGDGYVMGVVDTDDVYYTMEMPKSAVQFNRAARHLRFVENGREDECPFVQNDAGRWVKRSEDDGA